MVTGLQARTGSGCVTLERESDAGAQQIAAIRKKNFVTTRPMRL